MAEYHIKLLNCVLVDYDTGEEVELYPNAPASLRLRYSHRYYIKGSAQNINGVPPGPRTEADPGSPVTPGFFVAFITAKDNVGSGEIYTGRKISTLNEGEVWSFRDPHYGQWIGESNQGWLIAGYEWWDESGNWKWTQDLAVMIPLEPLPPPPPPPPPKLSVAPILLAVGLGTIVIGGLCYLSKRRR
jgi:hypothetical protein